MQPIIRALCASTLAVAASVSFAAAPMDGPQSARAGWHPAIQSGYDLLAEETAQLAEHASRYCAVLTTVTKNLASNSKQLSADWQSFKTPYLNTEAYQVSTLKSAMAALEILEEKRLAKPMGLRGNGKRNSYITDAWRSGTSLLSVEATLRGLQQHFLPEFLKLLEQKGELQLAKRIQRQFDAALDNYPEADRPMTVLLSDDKAFRTLQGLYVDVSQLATLVNDQAAVALGVVRGFNSSDGD